VTQTAAVSRAPRGLDRRNLRLPAPRPSSSACRHRHIGGDGDASSISIWPSCMPKTIVGPGNGWPLLDIAAAIEKARTKRAERAELTAAAGPR
jgi:hypothetical protein